MFRKSSGIAEIGMAQLVGGAPHTGVVSEKEAREEDTKPMISHDVDDETSSESDTDTGKEEEDAAQEHAAVVKAPESAQDAPRWSASGVETYAIQCNTCFKWRVIPSKERYETIGEHILEKPFVCAHAQDWCGDVNCDVPADLDDNEPTVLWAIDKHNIPRSPKGFYRKVVLRAENAKKFADIYYKAPCGKTLRSMVQVQKYLDEHPELGVKISQFSFTSPKGRADALAAGVSTKRSLKNETPPRAESQKRIKGYPPPPSPQPLNGKGPHATSKNLFDSKSKLEKSGSHPMAVKKEKRG